MACCGQKRAQLGTNGQVGAAARPVAVPSLMLLFEYIGTTERTVIGSVTGRSYRFAAPGARMHIDAKDVRSLAAIPDLKRA